ncbi:MAG: DUF1837 domain-containing protein [Christensenellales bacterium]
MKKLCLGTLLRILCDSRIHSSKQYVFLNELLSTATKDERFSDEKFQGALLSGKNNLTDYEEILTCDKKELVKKFEDKVKPYFDEDGQRLIIICIQDVLKEDSDISDTTIIGFDTEGYTKQDIICKQVFPFSAFLANVYYYCTTAIKNIPYKAHIKNIRGYAKEQRDRINEVQLETKATHVQSQVKLTLDPKPFNEVFTEVKDAELALPNNNELKIYRLDVVNSQIDYRQLQDFIIDNIGRYIYSRGVRNRYDLKPNSFKLARDGLRSYNKRVKIIPDTNHFNEIMLYSFLECVLGAPKIFSKMELQDRSGTYNSLSSGIHVCTFKQGGQLFNQLIFGATDTVDKLETAVDNALNQVAKIRSATTYEHKFLENTILNNEFDAETNKALESILLPQKESGMDKPNNAFGLFLGYTVKIADEPNNERYKINLEKQMKIDITKIAAYLEKRIKSLELLNHSFYVYILPLNNALDTATIMEEALKVGE